MDKIIEVLLAVWDKLVELILNVFVGESGVELPTAPTEPEIKDEP